LTIKQLEKSKNVANIDKLIASLPKSDKLQRTSKEYIELANALSLVSEKEAAVSMASHNMDKSTAQSLLKSKGMAKDQAIILYRNALNSEALKNYGEQTETVTNANQKFTKSFSTGATFAKAALATAGVSLAFTLVSKAISIGIQKLDQWVHRNEIAVEKANKARSAIADMNTAFQTNKSTIEKAISSYDRLSAGISTAGDTIANISLSTEDFETFLSLSNELAAISPSLVAGLDKNGNAILNLGSQGHTAAEGLKELLKAQEFINSYDISTQLSTLFEGTKSQFDSNEQALEDSERELDSYKKYFTSVTNAFSADHEKQTFSIDTTAGEHYYKVMDKAFNEFYNGLSPDRQNELVLISPEHFLTPNINNDKFYDVLLDASQLSSEELDDLNSKVRTQAEQVEGLVTDAYGKEQYQFADLSKAKELGWKDFLSNLAAASKSNASFYGLDESMQEVAAFMITTLPSNIVKDINQNDPYDYVRTNIVAKLSKLTPKDANILSNAYTDLLHFDTTTLSPNEINNSIAPFLNTISKYVSDEQLIQIKTQLTYIPDEKSLHSYQSAMSNASKRYSNKDKSPVSKNWTGLDNSAAELSSLEQFVKNNSINTEAAIEFWIQCLNESHSAEAAMNKYTQQKNLELAFSDHAANSISKFSESVKNSSKAIEEQSANGTISAETWNSLKESLPGVEAALEQTASGMQLNTDTLRKLNSEQANLNMDKIIEDRQTLTEHYANESKILEQYMLQLLNNNNLTQDQRQELEALAVSQNASLNATSDQIASLEFLDAQLKNVTSKYTIFKNAMNSADAGNNYDYLTSSKSNIQELVKNEDYGKDDYRTFVDLFSAEDMSNSTIEELQSAYAEAFGIYNKYFTSDKTGIDNFKAQLSSLDSVEYNAEDKLVSIQDIEKAAADAKMSVEAFEALLGKLKDKGITIEVAASDTEINDSAQKLLDLYQQLANLENERKKLGESSDTTAIDTQIENITMEIEALKPSIQPEIDLNSTIEQIYLLEQQIAGLDPSNPMHDLLVNQIRGVQEALATSQGLELSSLISVDTVETDQSLDETTQKVTDLYTLLQQAQNLVVMVNDNGELDALSTAISTIIDQTYTIKFRASGFPYLTISGSSGNGGPDENTPPVSGDISEWQGSAHARGSWNVGRSGKSLVGELGRELVVRGSRYFTVGDNGAEFVPLKSNDIIFNHCQTESLLNNGRINSRGKAYATGSADITDPDLLPNIKTTPGNAFARGSAEDLSIDWFEHSIKLESDRSSSLRKNVSSSSLSYLGLAAAELEKATAIIQNADGLSNILESDMTQLQQIAKEAGMSLFELFRIIENGGYNESRRSYLAQIMESDERQLANYEAAIKQYQADYEALISELTPEMRQKIEEGSLSVDTLSEEEKEKAEKAIDAFNKVQDHKSEKRDLELEQLEHIKDYYDNEMDYLDQQAERIKNSTALIEAQMDYLKASGQIITDASYYQLIENNKREAAILDKQIALKKAELAKLMSRSDFDTNSEDYLTLKQELDNLELAEQQLLLAQEQLRNDILNLPIENIDILLSMYDSVTDSIKQWGAQMEASGRKVDRNYYQMLIGNGMEIIDQYRKQARLVRNLMDEYEEGSDNWNTLYTKLQGINSAMSSMVENLYKWNEALLQIPMDTVNEFTDKLQKAVSAMASVQNDYNTVISAVTGALKEQIDLINEERDLHKDNYDSQIDVLQERLERLRKQNEALRVQAAYEQALYDLQTAA